jgi:hypothetical protein
MARTAITVTDLTINASCTSVVSAATTAGAGWEATASNFSKLFLLGYNSDTGVAAITINAASSGTDWAGKGIGSLSTSIASSEYRVFGPFEGFRFASTNGSLQIDSDSTCSTLVSFYAWLLP